MLLLTNEDLYYEYQIALEAPNGYKLYAQELTGDGYDSDFPFDFYVVDDNLKLVDQDVIDGTGYREKEGINWKDLIEYAANEYSPECKSFQIFVDEFENCIFIDADTLADQLYEAGIL